MIDGVEEKNPIIKHIFDADYKMFGFYRNIFCNAFVSLEDRKFHINLYPKRKICGKCMHSICKYFLKMSCNRNFMENIL